MPRDTPRQQAEIDQELDAWQTEKTELRETIIGLKASLASLQTLVQEAGTSAERAALTTRLSKLEADLEAATAELAQANEAITELRSRAPSPSPSADPPSGDPAPRDPPRNAPQPEPRKTRTGLGWL